MERRSALFLLATALLALSPLAIGARTYGVPVLYRGSVVGCADEPGDLVADLLARFGERPVYFFGIAGCPECAEMERYLRALLPNGSLAYVDVLEHGDVFTRLVRSLSEYVEDEYLKEVPVVLVRGGASVTAISIGVYRNDSFWENVLYGLSPERCPVRPIRPAGHYSPGLLASAFALGVASAFSPCVLYLYAILLLSYATRGGEGSLRRLLTFVLGLGSGYVLVIAGLYSLMRLLRPFAWAFFLAFGVYMILHSRGVLGCPVGGRSCRDVGTAAPAGRLAAALGGFFPFLVGVAASASATPCSAGYFVLLQAAAGVDLAPLAALVILLYLVGYTAPYLLFSILSDRFLKVVDRFLSKVAVIEFVGGTILVSVGIYLAIGA